MSFPHGLQKHCHIVRQRNFFVDPPTLPPSMPLRSYPESYVCLDIKCGRGKLSSIRARHFDAQRREMPPEVLWIACDQSLVAESQCAYENVRDRALRSETAAFRSDMRRPCRLRCALRHGVPAIRDGNSVFPEKRFLAFGITEKSRSEFHCRHRRHYKAKGRK